MASGIYNILKTNLMNKVVSLSSDTINVGLLTNSFSFLATNATWSDISSNEISGTGYTAGGQALSGLSVGLSGTSAVFTASNLSWSSATFTAAFAAMYDTTASNDLIAAFDFGGTISVSAGIFEIQWSGSGIISLN